MNNSVKIFLKTGLIEAKDPETLAEDCNRYIRQETQKSLKSARRLAEQFVRRAKPHGGVLLQTALRASGWALHISGKYHQAEKAYLWARQIVVRDPMIRARIDRILIDVYMYLGDYQESQRRSRISLATFKRIGAEADAAKTRINYANVLHRQDRHREASQQYEQAYEFFKSGKDKLTLALVCYNCANTQVQLFNNARAARLYTKAERLFTELNYALFATASRYGMAWLNMLRGDFHLALSALVQCEKEYTDADWPRGVVFCQLDRAEAYLGLNLWTDAINVATKAEKHARSFHMTYEAAKAALFRALASHATADRPSSRAALRRARAGFASEKNNTFLAAVEWADTLGQTGDNDSVTRLRAVRSKFSRSQLPLWEAVCDLQLLSANPNSTAISKRLQNNPAVKSVPHLLARWYTLRGDICMKRSQAGRAERYWRSAVNVLESVRAKLPPVEMRSAFLRDRSDPYRKLINLHERDKPSEAGATLEQFRTAGLWLPLETSVATNDLREKVARRLGELATQISALSSRIDGPSDKRTELPARDGKVFRQVQREVRRGMASLETAGRTTSPDFAKIIKNFETVSRTLPVVQFCEHGEDLIALIHTDGRARSHRYVDGSRILREHIGCWQVLLSRALRTDGKPSQIAVREEARTLKSLGSWLWSPLEIASKCKKVLLIPEGRTCNLPWQALQPNGLPLIEKHELLVIPSLRHYIKARRRHVTSDKVEVFVGSGSDLKHCAKEIAALRTFARGETVVHDPCVRQDWPESGRAAVWHFSGHARLRYDNPFYSSLSLADGPLFAADFRLKNSRVNLVTLAACRTGQQTFLPGEKSDGLVRSLLEMGARNVLASHWAVSDKSSALFMKNFYRRYFSGDTPGEALCMAGISVREKHPMAYDWAAFSLFGSG